jgi:hypothetical protein
MKLTTEETPYLVITILSILLVGVLSIVRVAVDSLEFVAVKISK